MNKNWKVIDSKNSPLPNVDSSIIKVKQNLFYLFGGRMRFGHENNDLYKFKFGNENKIFWKKVNYKQKRIFIPKPRSGHQVCLINKKIYLFGGYIYSSFKWKKFENIDNILYSFDLKNEKWKIEEINSLNEPDERYFHGMTTFNEFIFIFGGFNYGELGDFWKFNTITNEWIQIKNSKNLPSSRFGCKMVTMENKIYLIGGLFRNTPYKEIYEFDINLNEWNEIKINSDLKLLIPAKGFSIEIQDKKNILISGGELNYSDYLGDILNFNTITKELTQLNIEDPNILLYGHHMIYKNEKIYLLAGSYKWVQWGGILYFDTKIINSNYLKMNKIFSKNKNEENFINLNENKENIEELKNDDENKNIKLKLLVKIKEKVENSININSPIDSENEKLKIKDNSEDFSSNENEDLTNEDLTNEETDLSDDDDCPPEAPDLIDNLENFKNKRKIRKFHYYPINKFEIDETVRV
jgi:hypothetical protein